MESPKKVPVSELNARFSLDRDESIGPGADSESAAESVHGNRRFRRRTQVRFSGLHFRSCPQSPLEGSGQGSIRRHRDPGQTHRTVRSRSPEACFHRCGGGLGASSRREDAPLSTQWTSVGPRLFVRESSAPRRCLCCPAQPHFLWPPQD